MISLLKFKEKKVCGLENKMRVCIKSENVEQ